MSKIEKVLERNNELIITTEVVFQAIINIWGII